MKIFAKDIKHNYAKGQYALNQIDLDIESGEKVAIIGPNGAGKSTLLSILYGALPLQEGTLEINSRTNEPMRPKDVGYVPQNIALFDFLSIYDNLFYFGSMYDVPKKVLQQRIIKMCKQLLPEKTVHTKVKHLSGGMQRRVNLMCALIHLPKLIILDEPTVGVDIVSKDKIVAFIQSYQQEHQATLIYTSHLLLETTELCDKVIFIDKGSIKDKGFIPDLLTKYNKSNLKEVFVEIMFN